MRLTCLRDRNVPSPESETAQEHGLDPHAVWSVDADLALAFPWDTDVHVTQYECVTLDADGVDVDIRLARGCIDEGIHPVMVALIGDIDGPGHEHTPEWDAATEAALSSTGLAWYRTRGGYRVLAQLAEPFTITSQAREAEWSARYLAWCDDLAAAGVELDRRCKDWTRIFRAPNVMRDGREERAEIRGSIARVALPDARTVPAAPRPKGPRPPTALDAVDRAIAIAERMPPSIAGHGGDAALFACAREIATVLDNAEVATAVLDAVFNSRCLPPWPESKIKREATRACEAQAKLRGVRRALGAAPAEHAPGAPTPAPEPADDTDEDLSLEINSKGVPIPSLTNASRMLESWFGAGVWLDDTRGEIVCDGFDANIPAGDWTDEHTTAFRIACEQHSLRIPKNTATDAIENHARRHAKNPMRAELLRLAETWDGAPRIDTALVRHWGAEDTPATRAASRVFHLSMAARGLTPGEKVDTVLILCGGQGAKKSTYLKILAGDRMRVNDAPVSIGDVDGQIALRGKWLVELAELDSIKRKRDLTAVKAFVSIECDTYRPKYKRFTQIVPRTCVFVGTSNETDILHDPTGERRWMPVNVGELRDTELRAERDQLLAEAAARVLRGEQHWPTADEKIVLAANAEEFKEIDPWSETITAWVSRKAERLEGVTIEQLTTDSGAIPTPVGQRDKAQATRIGSVLRSGGWERHRRRVASGERAYVWVPPRALRERAAAALAAANAARAN